MFYSVDHFHVTCRRLVLAVSMLLSFVIGAAHAHEGDASNEQIHACLSPVLGLVRLVDANAECLPWEDAEHWSRSSGGGSTEASETVITRWGSADIPAGAELVTTGFAFNGFHSLSGSGTPVCLETDTQTISMNYDGDLLYPVSTSFVQVPGITSNAFVKCAVFVVPGPATVIWGTHEPPQGWSVVYRGLAMGAHHTFANPADRICVESEFFDGNSPSSGADAIYFPTSVHVTGQLAGYTSQIAVPCAVVAQL